MFNKIREKRLQKKQEYIAAISRENPYKDFIAATEELRKKEQEFQEQVSLDFQKWLESEHKKYDMSGSMPYCQYCGLCLNSNCKATQKERKDNCLCAKAYKAYKADQKA